MKYMLVVVLGCKPVGKLKKSRSELFLRVEKAAHIIKSLKKPKNNRIIVVLSGGTKHNESKEMLTMLKSILTKQELKKLNILVEDKSNTTFGNAIFTKQKIEEKIKLKGRNLKDKITKILIVTSDYHAMRAKFLFENVFNTEIKTVVIKTNNLVSRVLEPIKFLVDIVRITLYKITQKSYIRVN